MGDMEDVRHAVGDADCECDMEALREGEPDVNAEADTLVD